jgi:hypothetical protein
MDAIPGKFPDRKIFKGRLFDWFETGLEGLVWALEEDGKDGYDGLHVIEEGDKLTILGPRRRVLWKGIIVCDRKTGRIPHPLIPSYKQQAACGFWIHWIQRGFKPETWAKFFIRPEDDRLRAVLTKKKNSLYT